MRFDGSLSDFRVHAGDGRWWAVRLDAHEQRAANDILSAHPVNLPLRFNGEWLEIARHDSLPFAELLRKLAPLNVHEIKPVEQSFEELLHGFYRAGKGVHA